MAGHLATGGERDAVLRRLARDLVDEGQHRRRQHVVAPGEARIAAVGGEEKLHQVVGAEREEVAARQQLRKLQRKGRHLQHGTHLDLRRQAGSEEHTSELQSLMRISYAVFCLKKKTKNSIIAIRT